MRRSLVRVSVAVCGLGLLVACGGGGGREGYVATDAGRERPGKAVAPSGKVEFAPLDGPPHGPPGGPRQRGRTGTPGSPDGGGVKSPSGAESSPGAGSSGAPRATPGERPSPGAEEGPGRPGSPEPPAPPGPPRPPRPSGPARPPAKPAALKVTGVDRAPGPHRWCEDVTLTLRNTGGAPARAGTIAFGSHVIGALGVDWGTVESTRKLPAPVRGGQTVKKTWPICVDAWRVPWGMRIETRDVEVEWT
ncbi:hypothetical protein RB200_10890 [Streptomyces sp. PmtG]